MLEHCRLLVEGSNDGHVVAQLLRRHHIEIDRELIGHFIQEHGGIDTLLRALPGVLADDRIERLGVMLDADVDRQTRWSDVTTALRRSGTATAPTQPDPLGTIVEIDQEYRQVRVGIWFMPDNVLPGAIEHFVRFLVPPDDALWPRAEHCVDQIPSADRRFRPQHTMKAYLHTWLAWQDEPGCPMGRAVSRSYVNVDVPQADQFVAWLRRLFDL
jgi:hypothetical protein